METSSRGVPFIIMEKETLSDKKQKNTQKIRGEVDKMSSVEYRIEVFRDEHNNLSFGCPDYDLWGFTKINELIKSIEMGLKHEA